MRTKHNDLGLMCGLHCVLVVLIVSPCMAALPRDPNNAALLYYQALLRLPEPDHTTRNVIREVLIGGEPDARIREYVGGHATAIAYAERAAQERECDWGIWYSRGLSACFLPPASARFLSEVLGVHARILAADGDYRGAFGRCLTIRTLARHIGTVTTESYLAALGTEKRAQRCVCQILGRMPPDADTTVWLTHQLAATPTVSPSPDSAARTELEFLLQRVRVDDNILGRIRREFAGNAGGGNAADTRPLTDEEAIGRLRQVYTEFLDAALVVIAADMSYEEAYLDIQTLVNALEDRVRSDPIGKCLTQEIVTLADGVLGLYSCHVQITAHSHAFLAALEIYLWRATTGELPHSLPDGLPKDPYSGRDFEYSITEDGFMLRARTQDIRHEETKEYHFEVQ